MLLRGLHGELVARAWLALVLVACTSAPSAQPPASVAAPHAARPTAQSGQPESLASGSGGAGASSAPVPTAGAEPPPARPRFPPADFEPPFPRSTEVGDGRWRPFDAGDRPLSYTTVVHPHETSRFISVSIVAIDLTRAQLEFLPGVDDVGKQQVPFAPGLVPQADQPRLFAAFNGGFMPRHGRWGMRVAETTILPPREAGCTIALFADGSVRIRSWPALASAADLRALRQTPPCLLEQGQINAELTSGRDKAWAGQTPGIVTRRRSAIALSEDRQTLFYAIGVEASPKLLASALRSAGAHDAAQLDINWNWTRFLSFERGADGKLGVTKTLAPVEHTRRDYVEVPSKRDFFYLLRREAAPGP